MPVTPLYSPSVISAFLKETEALADPFQVNGAMYHLRRARHALVSAKEGKMKGATRQMVVSEMFHGHSASHTFSHTVAEITKN